MRYLFILLFFTTSLSFAFQKEDPKVINSSFVVSGVCEMCKTRIETGTLKIKGVKYANWDIISNKISLIYNSRKIKLDEIHKQISLLGHSTEKYDAPEKIYNALPDCCKYKSTATH